MDCKFNGTVLDALKYNGNDLDSLKFNGTTVWQKGSPGVAATLSLTLPYQTNLMVWAYFDNNGIYVGESYGLRVGDIVDNFNSAYGSQGYTATYSGYTINISSPQATGGDCNGKVFKVEYRSRFTGDPDATYSAALTGGQNAY